MRPLFKIYFKKTFLLLSATLYLSVLFSQAPSIQWQTTLGGSNEEQATFGQQTLDGGYVVTGSTASNDYDVSNNHGEYDTWVVKLNSQGSIDWQKAFGGSSVEDVRCIIQTADSGYMVCGSSSSHNGDVTGHHGGYEEDYWIVKLNKNGIIDWQKSYGGSSRDHAVCISATSDNGYIISGITYSTNGDVTHNRDSDYGDDWVVKIDSVGNIKWQKTYGGSGSEYPATIKETLDKGYVIAGYSNSNNGDIKGNHGDYDYWIFKIDSLGAMQWQKSLGGSREDYGNSIIQLKDSGYIFAGYTLSNNGDVTGSHGNSDCWIVKLSSKGGIEWQKAYGGSSQDMATSMQQTSDGGFVIAGSSASTDGDVTYNHGVLDDWVIKIDSTGILQWQKAYGGSKEDAANCIQTTTDGGYVLFGDTQSSDGDVTKYYTGANFWVVKLTFSILQSDLVNFNAKRSNSNAEVSWQTSTEINTNRFVLKRSFDGVNFYPVSTIKAAGKSNKLINYHYTDLNIEKLGSIYYQLQLIDNDGKSNLSNVIKLPVTLSKLYIQVSPNPVLSKTLSVHIETDKTQPIQLIIDNSLGKKIINEKRILEAGSNTLSYNTTSWTKGIYYIQLSALDGSIKTLKVVKP
jgi:hypothetical protein